MLLFAFMFGAGYLIWTSADCPAPVMIENGHILNSNWTNSSKIGRKLQVICEPGYRLLGGSFIECSLNGTWITTASCIEEYLCNVYFTTGRGKMDDIYYRFPKAKFTASSTASPASFYGPKNAQHTTRETSSHSGALVAGTDTANEYIQAEFVAARRIMVIHTGGRYNSTPPQYVTSFYVYYSQDCVQFSVVTDMGANPVNFTGNTDETYLKRSVLPYLVLARCIRINPTSWNNRIALRIAIIGCDFCKGFETQHGRAVARTVINSVTIVQLSCESGYELSASSYLTCFENGSWSNEPPYCKLTKHQDNLLTANWKISNGDSADITMTSLQNISASTTTAITRQWEIRTTSATMTSSISPDTTIGLSKQRLPSAKGTSVQPASLSSLMIRTIEQTTSVSVPAITSITKSPRKIPKTMHLLKSHVTMSLLKTHYLTALNTATLPNIITGKEPNVSFLQSKILPIALIILGAFACFVAFGICIYILINRPSRNKVSATRTDRLGERTDLQNSGYSTEANNGLQVMKSHSLDSGKRDDYQFLKTIRAKYTRKSHRKRQMLNLK